MEVLRVSFPGSGDFHRELKRRVSEYFEVPQGSRHSTARMYLKTALVLAWSVSAYLLLMFAAVTWWQSILLAIGLALGMAGIAFNIQHDANHGGYSRNRWVNQGLSLCLDLIGGSSYVWYWKHNIVHHTYTNISGIDVDVDIEPFLRLAPDQKHRWYHRYQHIYIWFLYGLLSANWQFWADYRDLANGHVGGQPFPRPSAGGLAVALGGKGFFYFWSLVLPLLLHPTWAVLGLHALTSFTLGIVLTTVFQLAHCVEEADLLIVDRDAPALPVGWAEHQVRTTANFAPGSRILTWYLGGLNYQVEHHLFPKVCHVHYPALSPIVAATCRDFGIPYQSHPTLWQALESHLSRLRQFGRPEPAV
ncbi:MAG: acyl-CoA desaturase [Isosphaeraceae bacterium]|nr:acyl-CoA desaturase [Isosphaeraceae bacterium]